MRISVVLPCYNCGPWVAQALQSVAGQTLKPHEIIVVDDGSTDDSLEQIRKSGVAHTLLQTQRANGAGARNAGIDAATGDWIAFQDADDVWYQQHLERAAAILTKGTDAAFLSHSDCLIDERRQDFPPAWPTAGPVSGMKDRDYLKGLAEKTYLCMPACIIRRDALLAAGKLDPEQVRRHDLDMWLRVIAGKTWSWDPHPQVAFRVMRAGSLSKNTVSGDYFMLRALLKNRAAFAADPRTAELMAALIHKYARRAMSSAYEQGGDTERELARKLALPELPFHERMLVGSLYAFPKTFVFMNGIRRRVLGMPPPAENPYSAGGG